MDRHLPRSPTKPTPGSAERSEHATSQLFARIYQELHAIAHHCMRGEGRAHTLQATALLHEVFLQLVHAREQAWTGPTHLLAVAARAIRRVLINHAIARRTQRRGGNVARVPLDHELGGSRGLDGFELLALGEALEHLERLDARQGQIVELRFFGGLSTPEIARILGVSPRTVEGEWSLARAWLRRRMSRDGEA